MKAHGDFRFNNTTKKIHEIKKQYEVGKLLFKTIV